MNVRTDRQNSCTLYMGLTPSGLPQLADHGAQSLLNSSCYIEGT